MTTINNRESDYLSPGVIPATPPGPPNPFANALYGDGSDGDVTLVGNITLARDMYYNSLNMAGFTIDAASFRIFVRTTLTIPAGSIIRRNGGDSPGGTGAGAGVNGSGGTARGNSSNGGGGGANSNGTAGVATPSNSYGGAGGAGGAAGAFTGGAGGAKTPPVASRDVARALPYAALAYTTDGVTNAFSGGAGGGGGGGNGVTDTGGGGGGGGGIIVICARVILLDGIIQAKGGNGGEGAHAGTGVNHGGGGGGGGGLVILIYGAKSGAGSVDVSGGIHGTGNANPGVDGNAGTFIDLPQS